MDIRKIKKLIELVEESGIAELEISEGEESVRISRNGCTCSSTSSIRSSSGSSSGTGSCSGSAPAAAPEAAEAPAAVTGHQVLSPMVGTFYSAQAQTQNHS